jgi:hypothetical protein
VGEKSRREYQAGEVVSFADTGFAHLKSFFDHQALDDYEDAISALFFLQARKIDEYRDIATPSVELYQILEAMEAKDKEALYQVQKMLPRSPGVRDLFGAEFRQTCSGLLGCNEAALLIAGPGLLINRPNTTRLLYKWHSEAHYYPKRRRFLNIWFPVFADKTKDNGVMSVKLGSHKRDWPFAEYSEGANSFRQFEVPENFVKDFDEHVCESKRGDLIIFDRNLIHRSNANTSGSYSFASVVRVWTPEDDLTLSGEFDATPYTGKDCGRANLVVRP